MVRAMSDKEMQRGQVIGYLAEGISGMISKKRGQASNPRISED